MVIGPASLWAVHVLTKTPAVWGTKSKVMWQEAPGGRPLAHCPRPPVNGTVTGGALKPPTGTPPMLVTVTTWAG